MLNYKYCDLVRITIEVYSACLNHALVTDTEEVMGLLLGFTEQIDDKYVMNIISTLSLTRNCKEKDRVEFDEIQISKACEVADSISKKQKISVNVVGWYHSHPKITIPPSAVDLNTQFSHQIFGPFVGLIFSVFNSDHSNLNSIKLVAFQTCQQNGLNIAKYIQIDFIYENQISSKSLSNSAQAYTNIIKNLLSEEDEQANAQSLMIEKDDGINQIILSSNRQILLSKIMQHVSSPFYYSLSCEIENMKNYLVFLKECNGKLKNLINNYEMVNKLKENDD
jgi:BRCA1/BRCA2-containing complex subunit 3